MKYFVVDDTENEDEDYGCFGWLVTTDEQGADISQEVARFRNEADADKFAEMKNA
jgi:hypothetical protein